jgi:hypothetical protein
MLPRPRPDVGRRASLSPPPPSRQRAAVSMADRWPRQRATGPRRAAELPLTARRASPTHGPRTPPPCWATSSRNSGRPPGAMHRRIRDAAGSLDGGVPNGGVRNNITVFARGHACADLPQRSTVQSVTARPDGSAVHRHHRQDQRNQISVLCATSPMPDASRPTVTSTFPQPEPMTGSAPASAACRGRAVRTWPERARACSPRSSTGDVGRLADRGRDLRAGEAPEGVVRADQAASRAVSAGALRLDPRPARAGRHRPVDRCGAFVRDALNAAQAMGVGPWTGCSHAPGSAPP